MAGISSKALNFGSPENKKKYNGIEFDNDFDLNTYEAFFRNLDPQTGRWWQIDPEIENMEAWSPYASNYDNPITYNDPLGDEPDGDGGGDDPPKRSFWQGVKEGVANFLTGAATSPIVSLTRITMSALDGDFKPAATFLAPSIGKADDAVAFVKGDAQTKGKILTETGLEIGSAFLGEKIIKVKGVEVKTPEVKSPEVKVDKPYQRPNNATTKEQRTAVQNQPCVKCGNTSKTMVAGHKKALVKEYYETGTIDKNKMKSKNAVQPECPTCSAKEGAEMSKYSKDEKKKRGF